MKKFIIKGPNKAIKGEVDISGAKNSCLPLMAASILFKNKVTLKNVPFVKDVLTMKDLLVALGSKVDFSVSKKTMIINNKKKHKLVVPYDLVSTMRAGVLTMGPLLARYPQRKIKVALGGGCALGVRDTNWHLAGFKSLGASNNLDKGYVNISTKKGLIGSTYKFPKVTVTGTSNLIMASVFVKGTHHIKNISIEPEVIDLINFLNNSGADIKFLGKRSIKITGVKELISGNHTIIGDRIEAFSYLCVGAITNRKIKVNNINPNYLKTEIGILKKVGYKIQANKKSITLSPAKKLNPIKMKYMDFPQNITLLNIEKTKKVNLEQKERYFYKSNKFILHDGKMFASKSAMKRNQFCENFNPPFFPVYDEDDFWVDAEYYYLVEKN